jgi:hypothetical protein
MSEIRATTISDAAGTGPITLTGQSAAKAWCNLNGTTFGLRDSFNISSASDEGTGEYKFNYSNNMGNGNYSVSFTAGNSVGSSSTAMFIGGPNGNTVQVGSTFCNCRNAANTSNVDRDQVFFQVFGDLA